MTSANPPGYGSAALVDPAAWGTQGQLTVAVIDDTAANVVLLQRLITGSLDVEVWAFTDPVEALARFEHALPDLVLLDLHMPGLDGFAVMDRLKDLVRGGDFLPVLVLTSDVDAQVKQRALANGAKDFLTKPFNHTEVLLRVWNLLETQALYRRLGQHNADLQSALDVRLASERAAAAEEASRRQRIDAALSSGALTMAFQPVVDLVSSQVVGMEALARFSCVPVRPPNEWFAEADEVCRGGELELAAISAALEQLPRFPPETFMALNLSPATAATPSLERLLAAHRGERVVVELTEHTEVGDYPTLLQGLDRLRRRGVRVAVDDTGAGYAGLQRLLRIHPDIVKLDIALTRDIDTDPIRRSLATALVTFAQETGATIIAEGVETADELAALQRIGISWAQGYHLGRPQSLPLTSFTFRPRAATKEGP